MESIFKLGILMRLTDMVSGPVNRINMQINDFARRVKELQPTFDRFKEYGAWIAGAGVVGAIGLGAAVTQFANLEEAQLRLRTTLMDTAGRVGPEYEKLTRLADELGTALPGSTKDMVMMFTALREQGVQTSVILGGVGKAAAQFATLMKIPYAEGATKVAKFVEAFGIADSEAGKFMDTLQRLKDAAGESVGDMYESMKYLGGTLKALRVQGVGAAQDVSAAMGVLATNSIEGSQAGTNFRFALQHMASLSHKLDAKKIKDFIGPILGAKDIKLKFFDDTGNFVGIRNMVMELEKLKKLNPQQQLNVVEKLFGIEGGNAMLPFINSGVAGFDAMVMRMKNQADMQTKINEIMSGAKMQWETLTGTVANVVAHVGGVVAKVGGLVGIMKLVNSLAGKLDSWILANPKTAGIIGGIAVALTVIALTVGGLLLMLSIAGTLFIKMAGATAVASDALLILRTQISFLSAASMWTWLTNAATGFKAWTAAINAGTIPALLRLVKAIWAVNIAVLSNPLTWIVVAIAAVIAGLVWMYKHLAWFKNLVDLVFFALGFWLGLAIKGWKELIGWIIEPFRLLFGLIAKVAPAVGQAFAGAWNAIPDVFKGVLGAGKTIAFGQGTVAAPPGAGALKPLSANNLNARDGSSAGKGVSKTSIRIGNIELPGVTNAGDFVKQLQMLVEAHDAN